MEVLVVVNWLSDCLAKQSIQVWSLQTQKFHHSTFSLVNESYQMRWRLWYCSTWLSTVFSFNNNFYKVLLLTEQKNEQNTSLRNKYFNCNCLAWLCFKNVINVTGNASVYPRKWNMAIISKVDTCSFNYWQKVTISEGNVKILMKVSCHCLVSSSKFLQQFSWIG